MLSACYIFPPERKSRGQSCASSVPPRLCYLARRCSCLLLHSDSESERFSQFLLLEARGRGCFVVISRWLVRTFHYFLSAFPPSSPSSTNVAHQRSLPMSNSPSPNRPIPEVYDQGIQDLIEGLKAFPVDRRKPSSGSSWLFAQRDCPDKPCAAPLVPRLGNPQPENSSSSSLAPAAEPSDSTPPTHSTKSAPQALESPSQQLTLDPLASQGKCYCRPRCLRGKN